jgi:hypothetical protein
MNLGQFHTRVSSAIKRGTSLDAIIPSWVAQAARLLEQNYTFSWMARKNDVTVAPSASPISYDLSPLTKDVEWIKPIWTSDGGSVWYGDPLIGVDERQVTGITGGRPVGYWISWDDQEAPTLHFDALPGSEYKFQIKWNSYTDWPVADEATPQLLLRGEMALFCQTLILFANEQRDPRMAETYTGLLQGALNTLLRSEEALKMSHQNNLVMGYSGLV